MHTSDESNSSADGDDDDDDDTGWVDVGDSESVDGAADDNRAVRVVYDVVADAAHDRTSHAAQTSRAYHYHRHHIVLSHFTDHLTRLTAALWLHVTAYL